MKKTLFVADNNELDLRILRLLLVRNPVFGRELYFKEGKSLMDYIRSNFNDAVNLPDVIFLEINMPQKEGWNVLEFLDVIYYRLIKPISVYIISTSVNAAEIQRAMSYHFVKEYIPKPIYRNKIIAICKEENSYKA